MSAWLQWTLSGFIQGLIEFLPVSKTGQLVIFQHFFGSGQKDLTFTLLLEAAFLMAVTIFYWREILALIKKPQQKYVFLLLIAALPLLLLEIFCPELTTAFLATPTLAVPALLATAAGLFLTDSFRKTQTGREPTLKMALFCGIVQTLAFIPGISRLGLVILAALLCGVSKKEAATFSFLVGIPSILYSLFFSTRAVLYAAGNISPSLPQIGGTIVALITSILTIKLVLVLLLHNKFRYFALYCSLLAVLTFLLLCLGM